MSADLGKVPGDVTKSEKKLAQRPLSSASQAADDRPKASLRRGWPQSRGSHACPRRRTWPHRFRAS